MQDDPDSSYTFLAPVLQSAISSDWFLCCRLISRNRNLGPRRAHHHWVSHFWAPSVDDPKLDVTYIASLNLLSKLWERNNRGHLMDSENENSWNEFTEASRLKCEKIRNQTRVFWLEKAVSFPLCAADSCRKKVEPVLRGWHARPTLLHASSLDFSPVCRWGPLGHPSL